MLFDFRFGWPAPVILTTFPEKTEEVPVQINNKNDVAEVQNSDEPKACSDKCCGGCKKKLKEAA